MVSVACVGGVLCLMLAAAVCCAECVYESDQALYGYKHNWVVRNLKNSTLSIELELAKDGDTQETHWAAFALNPMGPPGMAGAEIYMFIVKDDITAMDGVRLQDREAIANALPPLKQRQLGGPINITFSGSESTPSDRAFVEFDRFFDMRAGEYLELSDASELYFMHAVGPVGGDKQDTPMFHDSRFKTPNKVRLGSC
ncbi:hypothetical protein FVE85_0402 [Porphyridium purpureum]|uniref:DOMON domain-containing protein n=1 Tax=Porphyridium purpureum TaxID=35688 RepID=A0A5J4Z1B9_PORPP|nr:hypothetical protein FVE85_0402 [Porphyridium purpureum]|eukprot:POR7581..scf208_2